MITISSAGSQEDVVWLLDGDIKYLDTLDTYSYNCLQDYDFLLAVGHSIAKGMDTEVHQ